MYDTIEQQIKQQQQQEVQQQAKIEPIVDSIPTAKAESTAVNDQITDAVTQVKPTTEGQVPAESETTDATDATDATEPEEIPWYEKTETSNSIKTTKVESKPTDSVPNVEEDEDIKLLKEFKKSGKTLKDFVSEMNVPDYASMDDVTIIEMGLKQLEGFEGDDYASAVEEFNQMSLFQRKKLVQEYRNTFLQQSETKLKQLTQVPAAKNDKIQQTVQRFESEIDQIAQEISGKELYGFKVTDEMSTKISTFLKKEISLNRPDGSIDAELMADFALWRLYGKDIVRANVTAAKNAGRKEMLIATTNPSSGGGPSNANAGMKTTGADDAFNAYLNAKKR